MLLSLPAGPTVGRDDSIVITSPEHVTVLA
jgi:hypothetical protein